MAKRKNYPEECKRDTVDLVRSSPDRSVTDIAHGLGIHLETLRKWVRENRDRVQAADNGGAAAMNPRHRHPTRRYSASRPHGPPHEDFGSEQRGQNQDQDDVLMICKPLRSKNRATSRKWRGLAGCVVHTGDEGVYRCDSRDW
ncbi:transposase, partial [Streptomyces lavendulae]|uniref:transposase n=1 Tax=Streptomyces lavendulae TaxID=1914 RepID=UPI0033C1B07E